MTKRHVQFLSGVLLSILLVYVLFRKTDWADVLITVGASDPFWLLASQAFLWLAIFCRTLRWAVTVRTCENVGFRPLFSATQVGLFANLFLPGRLGEIIRAMLLSRLASIPLAQAVVFVFIDRLTDLAGLAVILLICVCGYHPQTAITLPAELSGIRVPAGAILKTAYFTGGVFVIAIIVLTQIAKYRHSLPRLVEAVATRVGLGFATRAMRTVERLGAGLSVTRRPGRLLLAIFYSVATWGAYVAGVACILHAFHLPFPWYTPFAVQAFSAAAIALPAAPGFVGQFHFGVILGLVLTVPGVAFPAAQATALVTHILFLAPVTLSGIYCLLRENQGLFDLSRGARNQREQTD